MENGNENEKRKTHPFGDKVCRGHSVHSILNYVRIKYYRQILTFELEMMWSHIGDLRAPCRTSAKSIRMECHRCEYAMKWPVERLLNRTDRELCAQSNTSQRVNKVTFSRVKSTDRFFFQVSLSHEVSRFLS